MSSSWKKVKNGRLSQLLSDRISERRRKGAESPLVVETGFPTSIIDLFVKNKDKLRNPLFRMQRKNVSRMFDKVKRSESGCSFVVSDVLSPPLPPPPPPPSLSASPLNQFSGDGGGVVVEDGRGGERECASWNLVSVAVLGLFLVVVLALGTKKFVVGITFSAFVLLFLEYLVKQQLIRPHCSKLQEMVSLVVGNVIGFLGIRKVCSEESNLASKAVMEIEEEQGRMVSDSIRGVEETEIEHNEIQCEKEKDGNCDGKVEVVYIKDIIRAEAGEGLRTRKSRRAKMRVKMREFLPKRLRKKKTQDVDVGVGNVGLIEEGEDQRELSSGGGSCLSSILRDTDELFESSNNQNEEETTTQPIEHSSSSYVYLVLIVLIGLLVGGRVLALILTVSWCLLLKSGGAIRRRCIKASILRSPAKTIQFVVQ